MQFKIVILKSKMLTKIEAKLKKHIREKGKKQCAAILRTVKTTWLM